ncbi:hypothetical protein Taro_014513 [Colocasia esculenta]|uniref:Protein kinase domain-containing protein n=1 Tax=Colocasia esculenta TaxID=4460 RepID=A0A843UID9_COLES|nr:hypothetical protein [Colocasia esculenta]
MSCFSFIFKRKKSSVDESFLNAEGIQNVTLYSYKELKLATEDFSSLNRIGEGGFGSVYKGRLRDGKSVAVKVLSSESRQGVREFLSELRTISNITHDNLVELYGCCVEGNSRILVYNYLPNNSLAQTLLGNGCSDLQFSWRTRTKICIGIARGLAFLHEVVKPHVVHRDIKASNVLLDEHLNPKISDFGLAKLFPPNATHVSTRVAGTIGYLAPEYAMGGQLTRKADIYSFGILLMEIVSGRCNTNKRLPVEDQFLLERIWTLHERNELVLIVDPDLNGDFDAEEACRYLKVGLLCTQDAPKCRPSMSTVVKMLTGEQKVDMECMAKPGLIADFMDLKIRTQKKVEDAALAYTSSSGLSAHDNSPLSSENTTYASFTFTAISDRGD